MKTLFLNTLLFAIVFGAGCGLVSFVMVLDLNKDRLELWRALNLVVSTQESMLRTQHIQNDVASDLVNIQRDHQDTLEALSRIRKGQ